jgi:hypothetical protein
MAMRQETLILFGSRIPVLTVNAKRFLPVKPVCQALSLSWQGQHLKLSTTASHMRPAYMLIPRSRSRHDMLCLPLTAIPEWINGINPAKLGATAWQRITTLQDKLAMLRQANLNDPDTYLARLLDALHAP